MVQRNATVGDEKRLVRHVGSLDVTSEQFQRVYTESRTVCEETHACPCYE